METIQDLFAAWARRYGMLSSTFNIGESIPAYKYEDGKLQSFSGASYYPVFVDGKATAIMTVSNPGQEGETFYLGEDWVDQYNLFTNSEDTLCVVVTDTQILCKFNDYLEKPLIYGRFQRIVG